MITETRNPETANSLSDLCNILNERAELIAWDDDGLIDDYPCDVTSLPTFGGTDPRDTTEVYSWNADSVLVPGAQITVSQSGWEIQPRCALCGEATFHCEHESID